MTYDTYSDCVDGRLDVSHVGYIVVVMKLEHWFDGGISGGGVGGTSNSKLAKFPFATGSFDCGDCCEDKAD